MSKKFNLGLIGKLGISVLALAGLVKSAEAGILAIGNKTTNGSIGTSTLTAKNIPGATEGFDALYDISFLSSPYTNALEIYTNVEGHKLSTDARPVDTEGWDYSLGVKGTVTCDNSLKFKVTDIAYLSGKDLVVYDKANPNITYVIPKDGSIYTISLPNLVNQGAGEYAQWRLDLRAEGDANNDGLVNATDLAILAENYGLFLPNYNKGNFNGDPVIDATDLAILVANYGYSGLGASNVPEPGMIGLLGLGGLGIAAYRRKRTEAKE